MSDSNRSGFGNDDPNRGPLDRAANAVDAHDDPNRGPLDRAANATAGVRGGMAAAFGNDDPNRGPLDRAENAVDMHDDPNRGPLDRAANAITGGSGGVSAALHHDDPNRGPLDRTANALGSHDDPNRGPLDRAENAVDMHDDPNRGPLDRAANAITGGTGGVAAAFSHDDPNRGPLDRTANAMSGAAGGVAGATGAATYGGQSTVSAIFDTQGEAERAVAELRSAGVSDSALSVIAQSGSTTTTRDVDGAVTDEHHGSIVRGILGGGALGAGLGVLALAIPGVGPLVAAGAIAASAVPGAMALGAAAGVAAGTFNETLKDHGIGEDDAAYYGERLSSGGVLVTVTGGGSLHGTSVSDILHRNGGHNVNTPRSTM
jgi:hypothetical protein